MQRNKKLNKIVKALSLLLFVVPGMFATIMWFSYIFSWSGTFIESLYVIGIFVGFYSFSFLINLPNLAVIFISWWILRKKVEKKYLIYYPALISNILMTILIMFLLNACVDDYSCRTSDAPLGTAISWILGFYLGSLFWSLPFTFIFNKFVAWVFRSSNKTQI